MDVNITKRLRKRLCRQNLKSSGFEVFLLCSVADLYAEFYDYLFKNIKKWFAVKSLFGDLLSSQKLGSRNLEQT